MSLCTDLVQSCSKGQDFAIGPCLLCIRLVLVGGGNHTNDELVDGQGVDEPSELKLVLLVSTTVTRIAGEGVELIPHIENGALMTVPFDAIEDGVSRLRITDEPTEVYVVCECEHYCKL